MSPTQDNSNNWITRQSRHTTQQFDRIMVDTYPSASASVDSARHYLNTICDRCNYLIATDRLDWNTLIPEGARILDMGCGAGWLSARLSQIDVVKHIFALDSSQHFLRTLLPEVVRLMNGKSEKIEAIEALFQPLFFPDGSIDVVVSSSALHHADNLQSVLSEARRVLRSGGRLIVLNETPRSAYRHWLSAAAACARVLRDLALQRYQALAPSISASCHLYDPCLGDRDYPIWYWRQALNRAGFDIEDEINTGLPTLRGGLGRPLIHFICTAR